MTELTATSASARYIGVDIGSTTAKATAFTADGTPVGSGSSGYRVSRPHSGQAEQDAMDWWRAVDACVAAIAAEHDLTNVQSIGITSQVDTHALVDADLFPIRPALLWQDVRAAPHAAAINDELGTVGLTKNWGSAEPVDASNPVARARWFMENEPDSWQRSRWLLLPKDFVNARLTGRPVSDPFGSFKVVGIDSHYVPGIEFAPGLADRLPPLHAPHHRGGELQRVWHGIPAGTTVATGTMDGFGNVLGSGLSAIGDTMLIIGTSIIIGAIGRPGTSGPGVVSFAPYLGRQVQAGPTQSGGDSLRWWSAATAHSIEDVLKAAADAPPGADGVVFAPHLMGERAPVWDSDVRGWFTGLDSQADFRTLSRAVIEGVAYSARQLLESVEVATGVPSTRIVISGGGSQSDLWCQVMADVLQRPVDRSVEKDTAVLGAAALALAALTDADPWERATDLTQIDRVFIPERHHAEVYDARFDSYLRTYTALRPIHTPPAGDSARQDNE